MPTQELVLRRPRAGICGLDAEMEMSRVVPTLQVGRWGADVGGGAGSSGSPLPGLGRAVVVRAQFVTRWVCCHEDSDMTECTRVCGGVRQGVLQAPWLQGTGIEAPGGGLNLRAALLLAPGALLSRPVPPTPHVLLPTPHRVLGTLGPPTSPGWGGPQG